MLVSYLSGQKNDHLVNSKMRQLSLILEEEAKDVEFSFWFCVDCPVTNPSNSFILIFPHSLGKGSASRGFTYVSQKKKQNIH